MLDHTIPSPISIAGLPPARGVSERGVARRRMDCTGLRCRS